MRRSGLLAVGLAAAAAATAPAHAAAPIDLGPGNHPHVAVDGTGIGHLTWNESGSNDIAHYCTLPKLTSQCANARSFTYASGPSYGLDSGVWPLLPGDGRVLVIDGRCCLNYDSKFLYASTDGGASFPPTGTEVGDDNNSGAGLTGGAIYTPANTLGRPAESILTLTEQATLGLSFQATGTTGPPATATANNDITQGDDLNGSIGVSGNELVAAWQHLDDEIVYWRRWSGTGDVNDNASWTPITALETTSIDGDPRLASGTGGIFLAYNRGPSGGPLKTVVRHFNGTDWEAPVTLADPGATRFDLVEDPGGKLHFVYVDRDGNLDYRFSTTPGDSSFSAPQVLLRGGGVDLNNLRIGVGTGAAWATWEVSGRVVAFAVSPSALPPPTRGSNVNVVPVKGRVLVKLPPGSATHARDAWTRRLRAARVDRPPDPGGLAARHDEGHRAPVLGPEQRRQDAARRLQPRPVRHHAGQEEPAHHRVDDGRRAQGVRREDPARRVPEAHERRQEAPPHAVQQREGPLPHARPEQHGDGARDAVHRHGYLQRHPHPGEEGQRVGAGLLDAEDPDREGRSLLPGPPREPLNGAQGTLTGRASPKRVRDGGRGSYADASVPRSPSSPKFGARPGMPAGRDRRLRPRNPR
jgi:hypothetical protein